jgi:short-subunit dehydrogenase
MSDRVLVIGATSSIAQAFCDLLAARGCSLVLAGRNQEELAKGAADLRLRYQTSIFTEHFDALDFESHRAFFGRCAEHLGGSLDGIVLCHGHLPDQAQTQTDFAEARRTIDINFTSAVSLLSLAANHLEQQRRGYLAAISSIAGDRGRQSNYTYGAAKAALTVYLQGLRNRLFHVGVRVLTIKPGFTDTPMTRGRLNPNSRLVSSPKRIAWDIDRALRQHRNVLYTPRFWRLIMALVRLIPETVFMRLKL